MNKKQLIILFLNGIGLMNKDSLIERLYERNDILAGEDGFFIFWPTRNYGSFTEEDLREIADELERKNKIVEITFYGML